MNRKIINRAARRYLITAFILLVGLGSAVSIYLTADNAAESGPVNEFENSKKYMHDLELYGGKANVLANELTNWFTGLWHGESLAFTVACITVVIALGFFFSPPIQERMAENQTGRGEPVEKDMDRLDPFNSFFQSLSPLQAIRSCKLP